MAIKEFRLKDGRTERFGTFESLCLKSEGSSFFSEAGASKWVYRPCPWRDAQIFKVSRGTRSPEAVGWIKKKGATFHWSTTDDMIPGSKGYPTLNACAIALLKHHD